MQFPFSLENSLTSTLAKLTPPHNKTPLQNQNYFPKSPPPQYWRGRFMPCYATKKNLEWYYFIFSPKNLLQNAKMSESGIFQSFSSMRNHQIFSKFSTPCIFPSEKNLRSSPPPPPPATFLVFFHF